MRLLGAATDARICRQQDWTGTPYGPVSCAVRYLPGPSAHNWHDPGHVRTEGTMQTEREFV